MPAFKLPTTEPERSQYVNALTDEILVLYPERDVPHHLFYTRKSVQVALEAGADPDDLLRSARNYRVECEREGYVPKFRIGAPRFYGDNIWKRYLTVTVYGRTREEWARSGQDLEEFDRLAAGLRD